MAKKNTKIITLILVIFLILFLIFWINTNENFDTQYRTQNIYNIPYSGDIDTTPVNNTVQLTKTDDGGYVRLYEDFDKKIIPMDSRFWQFPSTPTNYKNKYINVVIPIKLRAYDIYVPKFTKENKPKWMSFEKIDEYNDMRKVEIYSMYPQYINASSSTGSVSSAYVDSYIENGTGSNAFIANPSKYKKLLTVNAGEHKEGVILEPVRKVVIVGAL